MFLGIDVSKNTLDAALIGHNDRQSSKVLGFTILIL